MTQVSDYTGYARQWISKMAELGEVPDATRTKSGRWLFKDTPAFHDWIRRMARRNQSRSKQRYLHQDEMEVRRLEMKLVKMRVSAESRVTKDRITELTAQIATKRAAINDALTVKEIAQAVRRSERWVIKMVPSIPGVFFDGRRHLFQKSAELAHWMDAQRKISNLDRKIIDPTKHAFRDYRATPQLALLKCQKDFERCFATHPFYEWDEFAQKSLLASLKSFSEAIGRMLD